MILINKEPRKLLILRVYLWVNGIFLLFWWPLSHWFYSDFYHKLMGFKPGSYQDSLVKMIGVSGVIPVLLLFSVAKNPLKNKDSIIILITFSILLACTFLYLILKGDFPVKEYLNVGLSLFSALFLIIFYPRNQESKK